MRNNRGLTLIETLISLALVLFFFEIAANLIQGNNKYVKNYEVISSVGFVRDNLLNILTNDLSWSETIHKAANTNFSCLQVNNPYPADNCSGGGAGTHGSFALYQLDGNLYYDPQSPTKGFDLSGQPCDQFDSANGNTTCPFRVDTNWTPICKAGSCSGGSTMIKVDVTFSISLPRNFQVPININKFNFSILRNRL